MTKYKQIIINNDLHKQVKSHCAIHGIPMVAFVEAAIQNQLSHVPEKGDKK